MRRSSGSVATCSRMDASSASSSAMYAAAFASYSSARLTRCDALGDDDPRTRRLCRGEEAVEPGLETETILEDDLSLRQHDEIGWSRIVGVSVDTGADERRDRDGLASDLLHQITQNAEAGHHLEGVAGRRSLREARWCEQELREHQCNQ